MVVESAGDVWQEVVEFQDASEFGFQGLVTEIFSLMVVVIEMRAGVFVLDAIGQECGKLRTSNHAACVQHARIKHDGVTWFGRNPLDRRR